MSSGKPFDDTLPAIVSTPYSSSLTQANQPIVLGMRKLKLEVDDKVTNHDAEISLIFEPTPVVIAKFLTPPNAFGGLVFLPGNISHKMSLIDCPDSPCTFSGGDGKYTIGTFGERELQSGARANIAYVTFHLLNFMHFVGQPVRDGGGVRWARVVLEHKNWRITIDELPNAHQTMRDVASVGGYAVTHVGRLERINGAGFESAAAQKVLDQLSHFLCFAKGDWSTPLLINGYDKSNEMVWYDWSIRRHSAWKAVDPWWSGNEICSVLPQLFPRFMGLIQEDPVWSENLRATLYWFAHANVRTGGVDGAIILLQAAIERLTWTYIVHHKEVLPKEAAKKLDEAVRLRLVLAMCGISISIPTHFPELLKFGSKSNKLNGPEIFVESRNEIVHPGGKESKLNVAGRDFATFYFEVLQLGLEYFELVILHLCSYKGKYRRRDGRRLRGNTIDIE